MPDSSLVIRPRVAFITALVLSVVLVGASIFGWWRLPADIQSRFTIPQVATLVLFVIVMILMMMSIGLSRVVADSAGLRVRNGLRNHDYAWHQVRGVRFRSGDPWAYVLLDNTPQRRKLTGEKLRRQQMIAIQSVDGRRAQQAADEIVALAQRHSSGD